MKLHQATAAVETYLEHIASNLFLTNKIEWLRCEYGSRFRFSDAISSAFWATFFKSKFINRLSTPSINTAFIKMEHNNFRTIIIDLNAGESHDFHSFTSSFWYEYSQLFMSLPSIFAFCGIVFNLKKNCMFRNYMFENWCREKISKAVLVNEHLQIDVGTT